MTPHSNHSVEIEQAPRQERGVNVRRGRRVLMLVAGLGVLSLAAWVAMRTQTVAEVRGPDANARVAGDRKPSVRVMTLQPRPFAVTLEGLGTVTPLATVVVKAQVDGPLLSVSFEEGGPVHKGQVLAEIDPRPYRIKLAQARATLERDRAQLHNAELDLARFETLRDQKLIAQQQFDAQRSSVEQLRAGLGVDQAAADSAELQLAYTRIVSPIDGVAGIRQVDPGNLVHASDANGIVVLTRLDPIAVVFTLPQDDLPRLAAVMAEGARKVIAVSRAGDQVLGQGQLKVIDNLVNPSTATVRLKAEFPNPDHKLWPNQFVRARIEVSHRNAALVVPAAALQQGPRGTYVYVLTADNVASMRSVRVDQLQGEQAVIGSGVSAGARIVIEGQEQIKPNSVVTPLALGQAQSTREPGDHAQGTRATGRPAGAGDEKRVTEQAVP